MASSKYGDRDSMSEGRDAFVRADQFGRRSLLIGTAAMGLAAACSGPPVGALAPESVRTIYGPVVGERRATGFAFLGVPYAQPPVGELRFAAPEPPKPWKEALLCTRYGPTAQRKQLAEVTAIPEPVIVGDGVLNLNVFTPDPSPSAKLPVLVWIHGGGFVAGCSASPWYDGASFNRDGVVLVSIGYRLGVEGFLHLSDAPDNRAVLDWLAALRWVRDNIAAFGGDPAKVTIAGQSAGGGAVWALMGVPSAKGLFRADISESGALGQPNDRATAMDMSALFAQRTGTPAEAAAMRDLNRDQLQALEEKLRAQRPDNPPWLALGLAPWADGSLIPRTSEEMLRPGAAEGVPLLLGFTSQEFGDEAQSDAVLRAPTYRVAEARAGQEQPTWLYEFDWPSQAPQYRGKAFHCLDVPFAFDLLRAQGVAAVAGDNPPQELAEAIHGAWVSFVVDNDPGATWPRYGLDRRETMIWAAQSQVQSDPFARQRPNWLR